MRQESRGSFRKLVLGVLCVTGIIVPATPGRAHEQVANEANEKQDVHRHEHPRPQPRPGPTEITEEHRTLDSLVKSWCQWEHMTGDWAGRRPWLDDHGFTLEIGYAADFFYNMRGGLNTSDADQYRGVLGIGLTLDTRRMGFWEGGTFFLGFQQIHGTDMTERHIGDIQALNNNDAPGRTQLAEFWYEHTLLDGNLRIKLGKMDANADFAYVDYGGELINSSAGINPIVPMPQYPDPAIGAAIFIEPVDWMYVAGGVYDANGLGNHTGFDTAFHGRNDSFTVAEMGWRPTLSVAGQELPGTYRVGGWYHSGDWDVFFNDLEGRLPERTHRGNAGVYLNFDQRLYRENLETGDDEQGLGVFFQFAWAPSRYNEISRYYGFGGQYVGHGAGHPHAPDRLLRLQSGLGIAMRNAPLHQQLARDGVHSAKEQAAFDVRGPAGHGIRDFVGRTLRIPAHQHGAVDRPDRFQLAVGDDLPRLGRDAEPPRQRAVLGTQTVDPTVGRPEVDPALVDRRR